MKFKITPYAWQLEAITKSQTIKNLALFAEMGTGKSCALVNILRTEYYKHNALVNTLIVTPLVTLQNWKREILLHSAVKEEDIIVLGGTGQKKLDTLVKAESTPKIIVMNYESLLVRGVLDQLMHMKFNILVCDESHMFKSHATQRFKALLKLSEDIHYRKGRVFIMTGSPILNSPMDVWAQYRVLDNGETFGRNFYSFRAKYFYDENVKWSNKQNYFPRFVPDKNLFPELQYKIYNKALRVLKSECLDLPPLVKVKVPVNLSGTQKKAYNDMSKTFVAELKENVFATASIALVKALRLMQICCGHIGDEDGKVHTLSNPKLPIVKEYLEELTPNHKVILWCCFKHDYHVLSELCKEMGIKFCCLTGEQSVDEKNESIDNFNNDKDYRVIIANRKAGGIGVNLTSADYSIVYSRNFSLADELQSEARNYRGGSEVHEKITKIDLYVEDTIEEVALNALLNKEDVAQNILEKIKNNS